MKNQKYKDQNLRKNYSKKELAILILKSSSFLKPTTGGNRLLRSTNVCRMNNRCLVTYRNRSVFRKFKMTRGLLRKLISFSNIPGFKKSSW